MKDLASNVDVKRVISPVSVADNTAQVGQVVDGKGFAGVTYLIATGSLADADATFTVLLEESNASGSGFAAVADADLVGTEALAGLAAGARTSGTGKNVTKRIGYKGKKRYVQCGVKSTATAGTLVSVTAVLHSPLVAPTSNP